MTCTLNDLYPSPIIVRVIKIEKNEMGGACSTNGGEERLIQGFGGKTWGKETTWETHV